MFTTLVQWCLPCLLAAKVNHWTADQVHEFATLANKISSTQAEEVKVHELDATLYWYLFRNASNDVGLHHRRWIALRRAPFGWTSWHPVRWHSIALQRLCYNNLWRWDYRCSGEPEVDPGQSWEAFQGTHFYFCVHESRTHSADVRRSRNAPIRAVPRSGSPSSRTPRCVQQSLCFWRSCKSISLYAFAGPVSSRKSRGRAMYIFDSCAVSLFIGW